MEINGQAVQYHCRTCLVQLSSDYNTIHYALNEDILNLLKDFTNLGYEHEPDTELYPQRICHECYTSLSIANEFRTKVQQADELSVVAQLINLENQQIASCCICLRQYPQAVKSLTCQVQEAPHLIEWLEWSSVQKIGDNWLTHSVCRFCYTKLRDCYEWMLAAAESAEYLRTILQNVTYFTTVQPKQEILDNNLNEDYRNYDHYSLIDELDSVNTSANTILAKQENVCTYTVNGISYPTPNLITDISTHINDFTNSPPCEATTDPVTMSYHTTPPPALTNNDLFCKMCYMSFRNDTSYNNHICDTICNTSTILANKSSIRLNYKKVCHQCEKRFNKSILLEAHILQVHQGKRKPFICKYCAHAYITHTHLKRHLKTAHKQEWLTTAEDKVKFEFLDL